MKDLAITLESCRGANLPNWNPMELSQPLQLRSLESEGPFSWNEDDIWQRSVVWPMLERLSATNIAFLPNLAPQLTGLKSFRLRVNQGENGLKPALWNFLREQCPQLAILDLTGCTADINTQLRLWENLGKTLVFLRIHEDERPNAFQERPTHSLTEMENIANKCCKVRSLGLDIECIDNSVRIYSLLTEISD